MRKPRDIPDLRDIIDNAEPSLLRDFLWKHTKRSSAFELKLRAYLVESVDVPPGINKYSQVLGILVRHDVHGTILLTRRSVQILRDICEHFVSLQERHLQEGELRNAWEVGIAVISHLHLLMDKYHGPDSKLIAVLSRCYAQVLALLQLAPAPELKQTLYQELHEVAKRGHHVVYDLDNNAITCLIQSAPAVSDFDDIADLVAEKIGSLPDSSDPQYRTWCALLLKLPHSTSDIRAQIDPAQVYDIAYLLYATQDMEALSRLVKMFAPHESMTTAQQRQWAKWKFDVAIHSGDQQDIRIQGMQLLQLDQDIRTYRKLKEVTSTQFLLNRLPEIAMAEDLRCEIYAEEQQWEPLIAILRKTASLPMLIRHCEHILYHAGESDALLEEVTHAYAVHHGGPQSTEQIALLMETLKDLKQETLAIHIADFLKHAFPGRFDSVLHRRRKRKEQKEPVELDETDEKT